jgi:hypothetical protein
MVSILVAIVTGLYSYITFIYLFSPPSDIPAAGGKLTTPEIKSMIVFLIYHEPSFR